MDIDVTYPLALDSGAVIFGLYTLKEAGVSRNVIIDRSGKIIFLTRLFDRNEFDLMKKAILSKIDRKQELFLHCRALYGPVFDEYLKLLLNFTVICQMKMKVFSNVCVFFYLINM